MLCLFLLQLKWKEEKLPHEVQTAHLDVVEEFEPTSNAIPRRDHEEEEWEQHQTRSQHVMEANTET